ncbi:FG-GAP-like repeat-containing protein [Tuwongella immobilis]|uniref:Peptidase S1 domain-containing protein n=1 Tax=Tuwongella immobilis TaxID=692036 RepID=A0A6C2YJL2_9BACT|nr:FG-GAP-like repeat-containing protein [Tuwongella immobilis]VIP01471.1 na-ca exchanger integrin-beta4 : Hemolysin-type calcium-binding region domain protein OS=Rhodopirellula maiorica SM1 GN=RMSM_03614 PE=4 SV=1: Trypsin: VCBS: VCBS [Tuwongella immobilis]VTR98505.1 na-ca exchanger integrin-beta4 : Hemolysin-type calcium-binding region domain protein OS=Rhodopirellula maiorica SM1 GN=RMSM_03614 PE=4 SV=1: Trypsin: VCBS: VCBS [Tuwongella immobilis]
MSSRFSDGRPKMPPLRVEALDERVVPVVGAFAPATVVSPSDGYSGVVYLTSSRGIFTGTLLSDGRHILTAAHPVDVNGDGVGDSDVIVRFDLPDRTISMTVPASSVRSVPGWTGTINGAVPASGHDLAILTLPSLAPSGIGGATRYDIYRDSNEVGQDFTVIGYGQSGTGTTGGQSGSAGTKRIGRNTFDASGLTLPAGYSIPDGLGLVADFDNGTAANDAFAQSYGRVHRGLGAEEASAAPGDSGGPALLNNRVAGVSSFHLNGGSADYDATNGGGARNNISFGDYSGYTRVSTFASFIDGRTASAHTLVIDLGSQPSGSNGAADEIRVRRVGDTVEVLINGTRVQSSSVSLLSGLEIRGSSDRDTLILESSITTGFALTWNSIESLQDNRTSGAWQIPTSNPTPGDGVTTVPVIVPKPTTPGKAQVAPGTWFAVGSEAGSLPRVALYSPDGQVRYAGLAYESGFVGGVRVATGDVNGDGVPDLIVAPGAGRAPQILVLDGATGQTIGNFLAYEASFQGGVHLAVGDLDGDGRAEIVTSPDQGGGPRVRIFGRDGTPKGDFLGIEDPNFRGGARVAVGDINGDGRLDVLVGAGYGGGPRLAMFDGTTVTTSSLKKIAPDRFVFEPSLRNGVYLTSGDLNGDGYSDLIVGGGPGGGPRVYALSGKDLLPEFGNAEVALLNFFAGDPNQRGGVRLSARDLNGDGLADLVVGGGTGASAKATIYLNPVNDTTADTTFAPFGEGLFTGVFVG